MSDLTPNRKFDHAFAIVRFDAFYDDEKITHETVGRNISVKKIMWDGDAAEEEVRRLNAISGDGKFYFCQITRVERRLETQGSGDGHEGTA